MLTQPADVAPAFASVEGTSRARTVRRPVACLVVGALAVFGVAQLAGGVDSAAGSVAGADPAWLLLAAGAAGCSYLAAGLAQLGSVAGRVPLRRLVVVQLACAFTNRLLPAGVGGLATNVRCLRRSGLSTRSAGTAVATTATAGVLMHVLTLLVALPVLLTVGPIRHLLTGSLPGLAAAVLILTALAVVVTRPPAVLRRAARRWHAERAQLIATLRHPGRVLLLLGGSLGVTAAHAAAFVAALHAVGAMPSLMLVLAVYVAAVAAAGMLPMPGGAGGLELALLAGLTEVGVPSASAAAAVLAFRLLTFWLPIIPGVLALAWLLRRRLV